MRTAVVPWRGGIGASLTSVRAYERTWIFQHNAVASGPVPAGAGQLHGILMRLAAHRSDGEYVAGIISSGARGMHGLVTNFFTQSAPAHRGATRLSLYGAPAAPEPADRRQALHPAVARTRRAPHRARRRPDARSRLRASARTARRRDRASQDARQRTRSSASNGPATLTAPSPTIGAWRSCCARPPPRVSASAGCSRRRTSCRSCRAPIPTAPGAVRSASWRARHAFRAIPPSDSCFSPTEPTTSRSGRRASRPIGECTFFALHRLGILEYQRYVADKYGLLQARLRSRSTRLPEAA